MIAYDFTTELVGLGFELMDGSDYVYYLGLGLDSSAVIIYMLLQQTDLTYMHEAIFLAAGISHCNAFVFQNGMA